MNLINLGYTNLISTDKIITILMPDSAPVKRIVSEAKKRNMLIDATCGRKTLSVIVTTTNHIILSACKTMTLKKRIAGDEDTPDDEE
jgi:regulator of extracellular matrix RemA (YlzA/DUF370 family)